MKTFLILLTGIFLMQGTVNAEPKSTKNDKAILLIAFGTTVKEAWGTFDTLENMVRETYPDLPVSWAFTSKIVRKRLAERGKIIDSPDEAFKKLNKAGVKEVVVQSIHVIAGIEFEKIKKSVHEVADPLFEKVSVGMPLLSGYEDLQKVSDAVLSIIPKERNKDELVLFMGHGSEHHPADMAYAAMDYMLREKDEKVMLATVDGHPTIDETLKRVDSEKIKKCWLIPFMSVAGDHARNDMAGKGDDSWSSILLTRGIKSVPVFKGMGEYRVVAQVWLDHLKDVLEKGEH